MARAYRKKLHISSNLKLPWEAVTQTFAILAMRGVGKTYTASVMAEEFCAAGLPFAVLDPTGAWWGLRSSADGKGEGYPVMIIGGDHADAPLEETAGKVIADMLAEDAPPLVIDLSHLSKSAMRRFVVDFAERLYIKNREPLHLIIDEADSFAPQRLRAGDERMFGAVDEIVRRGRIRGLGCTLVTQRSAALNKDVLTQTEVLIVLRTTHPRDRAPVLEWMKVHATPEQLREVEASLAKLPKGDAWVMSAGWLDLFKRIHVRERYTFNSSATPTPGERRAQPRAFARIDPAILQNRLAEAIERQKATDPALLRRRITELERELKKKPKTVPAPPPPPKVEYVEVPVVKPAEAERLEAVAGRLEETARGIREGLTKAAQAPKVSAAPVAPAPPARAARPAPTAAATPEVAIVPPSANGEDDATLKKGELKVLTAIAQYPEGVTQGQLAVLTGYRQTSRTTYLKLLRSKRLIAGREPIKITDAGWAVLGPEFEPLPTGPALLDYWRGKLKPGELACLEVIVAAYPDAITHDELKEKTGYKETSKVTYLKLLRSRRLITSPARGFVRASEELF
jgi:hypothetical protein